MRISFKLPRVEPEILFIVFDLGLLMAELGRIWVLLEFKFVPTSLVRLDAVLEDDGNVADLGVTLSLSEYLSGAYL